MAENLDIEKLKQELKKQKETRDNLLTTTERMRKALYESQLIVKDIPNEENIWRDRFEKQRANNQQLESELAQLEQKLEDLNKQLQDNGQSSELAYSDMTDNSMRQLLRQLEKEKNQVEWQLKECEWRLDQEAAACHKAEEEKKAMLTQLHNITHQTQGETSKQ